MGTTLYSYVLKHEVILDVMTIAGLFVLRVLAGAVAVGADASAFLLLCTGMVALFLGFTKRRQEATSELHSGTSSRPVLEHYSIPFLDQMVAMVTASTVMSYAIYAVNSPLIGSKMLGTLPPVLYGIFRYLYLIYDRKDTRSTDAILLEDYGMIGAAVDVGGERGDPARHLPLARLAQHAGRRAKPGSSDRRLAPGIEHGQSHPGALAHLHRRSAGRSGAAGAAGAAKPAVVTLPIAQVGSPGNPAAAIVPFTDAIYQSCSTAPQVIPPARPSAAFPTRMESASSR